MKTIEIKLYKFNELSKEAQQKAIERLFDINVNYEWWDYTFEDAANIGIKLESFNLDRNRHAKGEFLLSANEVAANIIKDHGEQCSTYKTAQKFMEVWQPVFDSYMDESSENYESQESEEKLQEIESDFLNSLLEDYSVILQNESEYLQSDTSIIETIQANDYDFTEDGKIY